MLVAYVGAIAVLALVSRPGVVHVHVARHFQPSAQDLVLLGVKTIVPFGDDAVDLSCRDVDPQLPQLLQNQRLGHVCVMVLIEDKADQGEVEVAAAKGLYLLWERRHDRGAIWRLPPLSAQEGIARLEQKTLNRVVLISLERAPCWDTLDFDNDRLVDLAFLASFGLIFENFMS